MTRLNDVRMKASYDQSLSDSDNIEGFTPSSGQTFNVPGIGSLYFAVKTMPEYIPGQPIIDANGGISYVGFAQSRYLQEMCHADSLVWLRSNYEGQVTAYIRTQGTTYARYNCQLRFEVSEFSRRVDWYTVLWIFTIIEAL